MTPSPLRTPFFWVYWGISIVLWGVFSPIIFLLSFKAKYKKSLLPRFFLKDNTILPQGSIWFHACSLGEVTSLEPLLKETKHPLVISTTTQTGYEYGKKKYPYVYLRYLPFEPFLVWWMNAPKVIIVTEAELWPMIFFGGKIWGSKIIYINARISERSFLRAKKISFLYKKMFANIDHVYAQSEEDGYRLGMLGAQNITIFGNIKRFRPIEAPNKPSTPKERVIVAASTHEGEEEIILEAYEKMRHQENLKLIIVPRHPERFEKVNAMVKEWGAQRGVNTACYSQDTWEGNWEIMVVDVMGELLNMYAVAHTVILGGSFVPVGGHNPLEPASFGVRLISGMSIFNQKELFKSVKGYHCVDIQGLSKLLATSVHMEPSSLSLEGGLDQLKGEIYA